MTRRFSILVLLVLPTVGAGAEEAAGRLELTVKETAGIRRFGYPVHATIELPRDVTDSDRFRLLADGKAIAAQFRRLSAPGQKRMVALDFNANLGPHGNRSYTVEYGQKVEAGPEPKAGMKLEEHKESFSIRSGGMAYVVPRDLMGLLKEVRNGKKEYTRAGSAGLFLLAGKKEHSVGGPGIKGRVVRQGPLAIALSFEGDTTLAEGKKSSSVVEMTFPSSKSWIEVVWRVKPAEGVAGLAVDLSLLVKGTPTLVDSGAGTMVYTTLYRVQSALLRGTPPQPRLKNLPWEVLTGDKNEFRPFVLPAEGKNGPAEGWAHLMDRQRCTAVAVDHFGLASQDEIRLDADGRLRLWRRGGKGRGGVHSWRFWLHFVDMPVQVGALTSPQSMLAPLVVAVKSAR